MNFVRCCSHQLGKGLTALLRISAGFKGPFRGGGKRAKGKEGRKKGKKGKGRKEQENRPPSPLKKNIVTVVMVKVCSRLSITGEWRADDSRKVSREVGRRPSWHWSSCSSRRRHVAFRSIQTQIQSTSGRSAESRILTSACLQRSSPKTGGPIIALNYNR